MTSTPATTSLPRTIQALGENVLLDPSGTYVESRSSPGTFHRLTLAHGRAIACDCPGFTYRGHCRHLAAGTEALFIEGLTDEGAGCGCLDPHTFAHGPLAGTCRYCGRPL